MKDKIKRILLILNIILNVTLGLIIFFVSNLIYRYDRLGIWVEQNGSNQFYSEVQNIITYAWIIWGGLFLLAIILFVFELRKKN